MATSGELIREARLRAGLTQVELGDLAGKDRAQIARWERHAVQPSFETLRHLLRACGYDLSSDLLVYQPVPEPRLEELARLTPQERLTRHDERRQATQGAAAERWEPLTLIAALARRRVAYVLVGTLARILHGSDETTSLLEICPGMSDANQRRLTLALRDMAATADTPDDATIIDSDHGRLGVIPEPAGTRGGHDDLRRRANRDPLGAGLRAPVADLGDLTRIEAAQPLPDAAILARLRRLQELAEAASR
jgi:transcriptional regulator with XRE-family HTH domain